MDLDTISVDISGRGIATILLNRPDRGNAINATMREELARQLASFAVNDDVRVIVFRAAGRNFCTGADMMPRRDSGTSDSARGAGVPLLEVFERLDALQKPTIAAVQGACIGGGVALVACCDVVIATVDSTFSLPEARIGFFPSAVLPFFVRALGYRNFRRYALSGERISAHEALRVSLIHQIYEAGEAEKTLSDIADEFMRASPRSIAAFKAAAAQFAPALSDTEKTAIEERFHQARQSEDAAEGLAALREKRNPNWYRP